MTSPLKLEVVLVEKVKRYQRQKDGELRQIAQVYGKIINEKPDFDYYVVVFAPVSVSITSGVILPIPVSGMRINLGDEVVQGSPFGLPLNDVKNKIL